jgi:hypothetical protein
MLDLNNFSRTISNKEFAVSFLGTMASLATMYLVHLNKNLLFIILVTFLCSALIFTMNTKTIKIALGILSGLSLIVITYYLYQTWSSFFDIVEWDFLAFYIYGKAGTEGLAFYDPSSFSNILLSIHLPFTVSDAFNEEVIKVGVSYPPTSMLLIAPIGYLDLNTANFVWRMFIICILIIDMILIYNIFKVHESKWIQVLIIVSLTLILPGSSTTLSMGQTHFLLLFFLLLVYRDPNNWKSGMFLALAMIVKPIAAVWALYFLVNFKWKPIISFTVTGLLVVLVSVICFGPSNFITFFTSSPALRIPTGIFIEPINQSINAVFSRTIIHWELNSLLVSMNWIVLFVSLILVILTSLASFKLSKIDTKASFLIFLPLSLLIYPGSLMPYAVQLLPLFFAMLMIQNKTILIFFTTFLLILCISSFWANIIILGVFLICTFFDIQFLAILKFEKNLTN